MATLKDVEDCKNTVEDLAMLARKLGYRSRFAQLEMGNGATASDLFDFFEDNPGAIEAVLTWVTDEGRNRDGSPLEKDEELDEEDEECEDCGALGEHTERECDNQNPNKT